MLLIDVADYTTGGSMKYVIVYWSRYGNNKRLVEHLAGTLKKKGADTQVLTTDETNPSAIPKADFYVFSAAAEQFSLNRNMKGFMNNLESMDGKKYGIINTHGLKNSKLPKMEKLLSKKNMLKVSEIDFRVTGDTQHGNGLPSGWEAQLDAFATKLK